MDKTKDQPVFQPNPDFNSRVKDQIPPPTMCKCGGDVEIRHFDQVYGQSYDAKWPWMYQCQCCGSSVGMHPQTDLPLGKLADKKTRGARKKAKTMFFSVYGDMPRGEAYSVLATILKVPKSEAHFGWMDFNQCNRVRLHVEGKKDVENNINR